MRTLAATAAVLALLLTGCSGDDDSGDDTASDPAPTSESSEASAPAGSWQPEVITDADDSVTGLDFTNVGEPDGELHFEVVKEGDGPPVEVGQTITANYFGQLADEEEPFDESYSSSPFEAPIGVGSLIEGWDQAIPGIPVGSRVVMEIPPDLGYGDSGSGPIPPSSTLYFVIDILEAT